MKSIQVFFLLSFLAVLYSAGNIVHAGKNIKTSSSVEVGFAFYKLAGSTPDFRRWLTQTEKYRKAPPGQQVTLLSRGINEYRRRFDAFDPEKDYLLLGIGGKGTFSLNKDNKENPYKWSFIPHEKNIDVYPYEIAGQFIGIVVDDIDEYFNIDISEREYKHIIHNAGSPWPPNAEKGVNIILKLKPLSVDAEKPFSIGGHDIWLMATETVSMSMWKKDTFLWESQAVWYDSPTEIEIRKLFRE